MKYAIPLLVALMLSGSAFAQNMGGPGGQGGPGMQAGQGGQRPPGPPPEAYEACKGKKDGDVATMQTPQGRMQGNCRLVWVPGAQGQQGGAMGGQAGQQRQGGSGGQFGQMPGQAPGQQYQRY